MAEVGIIRCLPGGATPVFFGKVRVVQIEMAMENIDVKPAAFWVALTTMLSLSAIALAMLVFVLA